MTDIGTAWSMQKLHDKIKIYSRELQTNKSDHSCIKLSIRITKQLKKVEKVIDVSIIIKEEHKISCVYT